MVPLRSIMVIFFSSFSRGKVVLFPYHIFYSLKCSCSYSSSFSQNIVPLMCTALFGSLIILILLFHFLFPFFPFPHFSHSLFLLSILSSCVFEFKELRVQCSRLKKKLYYITDHIIINFIFILGFNCQHI